MQAVFLSVFFQKRGTIFDKISADKPGYFCISMYCMAMEKGV